MKLTETIFAYGHKNIQATHKSTFEVTKNHDLSIKGNCIIAVSADKALSDLTHDFRQQIQKDNVTITLIFKVGEMKEVVRGFGSSKLILTHTRNMIVRKSNYVCNQTLAINSNKAACDLSRVFVDKLTNPTQKMKITITVEKLNNFPVKNDLPCVRSSFTNFSGGYHFF
jgi:hypothetical protein